MRIAAAVELANMRKVRQAIVMATTGNIGGMWIIYLIKLL